MANDFSWDRLNRMAFRSNRPAHQLVVAQANESAAVVLKGPPNARTEAELDRTLKSL
ncbi:hypothetical protein GCM10010399_49320 [Dactylosporangium fulvum]|uniref:Uncharacterized protein n=1 Tax=Dactylosporangium fulvum TaxID=53359 RepID=A0ABY5VXV7_9ACTN|nr:hypothetical protein [Dactylosporangium fulvum]UWP81889.1 hypothetical protein Dfulv_43530 [Dactylosporangium fulvum]